MRMFSGFVLSKELLRRIEEKKEGKDKGPPGPGCDVPIQVLISEENVSE